MLKLVNFFVVYIFYAIHIPVLPQMIYGFARYIKIFYLADTYIDLPAF